MEGCKQSFLWDTDTKSLAVRASSGGKKSFMFQSRINGTSLRLTIGDVNTWGIGDARAKAREFQKLIDSGLDPRIVKAETRELTSAKREAERLGKLSALVAWQEYVDANTQELKKNRKPKWSHRYKEDHIAVVREGGGTITRGKRQGMGDTKKPGILRPLLDMPLEAITRDAVVRWIDDEAKLRPGATKRALSLLRAFIAWASDQTKYRAYVHSDACNRLEKKLPATTARNDCLQREQLKPWFDAVRKLANPVQAAYLQCLLLTGARRNEISSLQWDDIDFQWKSMTIRDKVVGERVIPLTPYVAKLLLELKRIYESSPVRKLANDGKPWKPSPWVFSSVTAANGRIQEPRKSHERALAAAGLPHISIHGLRRSFGTQSEWVECPAGIAAQIMGHAPSAIAEKHYIKRSLDLLRMWHSKIEGWILEQADIQQPRETAPTLKSVRTA